MDLTSLSTIKELLEKYDARPFKGLGQNFLINKGVLEKIIEAADLKQSDTVLEIGPGIGTLTKELAKKVKPARNASDSDADGKVIAVEKDRKMVEILKETLKDLKNIEIINTDALKIEPESFLGKKSYKIVANLPYNITSPVIRKFLESKNPPKEMILMVQKEVAQRICAKPPDMNLLAISVQFYSQPKIMFYVSKNNFWPRPKVDGAVIKVLSIKNKVSGINKDLFFKIVKAGFSQPRKNILNNLSKMLALSPSNGVKLDKPSNILNNKNLAGKEKTKEWLLKSGINPSQRAETLDIKDWIKLIQNYIINQ